MDPTLTCHDVARMVGVTAQTFRRWIRAGKTPPFIRTPTGLIRFNREDVLAWLSGITVNPSAQDSA